jgi:L-2-hydroxyglutarate oxidase
MRQNLRSGSDELLNSLFKTRYLAQCRKYCPELRASDLHDYRPASVRRPSCGTARWSTIF